MSAAARIARSISKNEFSRMLRQCKPPTGSLQRIGVAHSGGPDSTCLLFLIHRYLSEKGPESVQDYIGSTISLTVDHDLQPSSSAVAAQCSKSAQTIGVEHLSFKVPWSTPPYPPRPLPDEAFEATARTVRYHSLLKLMLQSNTGVIGFGHHSDDQIETALMRLGRGTTLLGASGMKPFRRWGMGVAPSRKGHGSDLEWVGYEGMNKWIIRPLLGVSKDRILATCDENNLEYTTDATNFQPAITLRNAVRQVLDGNPITESIPADIADKLHDINRALGQYEYLSVSLENGREQLRNAVSVLTEQATGIDRKVDSAMKRCMLPSPTGTVLFTFSGLAQVNDDITRRAMLLRVIRYVSFYPWGSIRADANRRKSSISQIISNIWRADPSAAGLRIFTAGGGVLWTPVTTVGGHIRTPDRMRVSSMREDEVCGWLASRQPPLGRANMAARGLANLLDVDVTQQLVKAIQEWELLQNGEPPVVQVLYDCRFLVCFDIRNIPVPLARQLLRNETNIVIYPHTRWYWPKVVEERDERTNVLHSEVGQDDLKPPLQAEAISDGDPKMYWRPRDPPVSSGWISIQWIRALSAY